MRNPGASAFVRGVLLGLLALGCSPGAPRAPLRIGTNPWPGYEFLWLAHERGFLRDRGVDVHLLEFESLTDARRAYEREHLDGFTSTIVEVLYAHDQSGRQPRAILVADHSDGADVILARAQIHSIGELRGRRVGSNPTRSMRSCSRAPWSGTTCPSRT